MAPERHTCHHPVQGFMRHAWHRRRPMSYISYKFKACDTRNIYACVTCVLRVYYAQDQLESLILELRDLKAAVSRMEGAQQGEAGQQGPLELGQLQPEQGQQQDEGWSVQEQGGQQEQQQQGEAEAQLHRVAADAVGASGEPRATVRPCTVHSGDGMALHQRAHRATYTMKLRLHAKAPDRTFAVLTGRA